MSDKPSQMTDADTVAACNALHRWLKSQEFTANESLAVLALTAGAIIGMTARELDWPAETLDSALGLVHDVFFGQVHRSLRDGKNLLDKG